MIRVNKVAIPKEVLRGLTRKEREFFLLVGGLGNELNILNKLLLFSSTTVLPSQPENEGNATQNMLLLKLLGGKLNEGWELIRKRFLSDVDLREYRGHLSPEGQKALEDLKSYFGKGTNLIKRIRKDFSFHFPIKDEIETGFEVTSEEDGFYIYVGEVNAHSLFFVSEVVTSRGLLEGVGASDHRAAMFRLIDEVLRISSLFDDFIYAFMSVFVTSHTDSHTSQPVDLTVPSVQDINLPFFIEHRSD